MAALVWPYFMVVAVFGWGGFGMAISALSSKNWVLYDLDGVSNEEGLFQGKINGTNASIGMFKYTSFMLCICILVCIMFMNVP